MSQFYVDIVHYVSPTRR